MVLPAVRTGVEDTETLVEDTDGVMHVSRVVVGVVALAGGETGLEV